MQTAQEVALAVIEAWNVAAWDSIAELVDPQAADLFKRDQVQQAHFEIFARSHEPPPEALAAMGGKWPKPPPEHPYFYQVIHQVSKPAELESLSATETLLRYLRYSNPAQLAREQRVFIGIIQEHDWLAHAVYRYRNAWPVEESRDSVDAFTLRRTPGGWLCLLNSGMTGGGNFMMMSSDEANPTVGNTDASSPSA